MRSVARGDAAERQGSVRGLIGAGTPLPAALRAETEARFGTNFSGVRVHDHDAAHALAQRQLARAFTLGTDIVFNRGRYRADSPEGRHLLAHELAHVAQQNRGGPAAPAGPAHEDAAEQAASALGRGGPGPIDAGPAAAVGVQRAPLDEGSAAVSSTAPVSTSSSGDGGTSNVGALTNEQLIAAMSIGLGRNSTMLAQEQERRSRLGHKWIEETWTATPTRLIQIVPNELATDVVMADMAIALGPPTDVRNTPILSEGQFRAFLAAHGIPAMTPEEYLAARAGRTGTMGALGGDLHLQSVQLAEARAFSRPQGTTWMGQRAEYGQMSHPLFGDLLYYDYNNRGWVDTRGGANVLHVAAERNFPIVDLRSRPTGINQSLKTSVQGPSGRYRYYAEGLGDLTGGSRPDLFATMLQNLGGGQTSANDFLSAAQLLIPPDDVPAFQSLLNNPTSPMTARGRQPVYRLQSFTPIFDGLLAAQPAQPIAGGPLYNSVAALDAAVAANVITQAQMDAVLQQRGQRAAGMVSGHGETVADLRADVNLRSRTGSPVSTELIVGPEYLAASRYGRQYGSWGGGVSMGALGSAPRGGLAGAMIAVITDTGIMLFDGRDNPEAIDRLERSAGYGFLGGTTGGSAEFAVQAQIQRQLLARTLTGGAPGVVPGTVMRGMGGAAGGGVASMAVETWQIATEEGPHSNQEVALREGRALVIGATSGFLATVVGSATTGALAGTVVPGVGNAVGLVVGILVGIGVALVMEAAIPRPQRTVE